MAIIKLTPTFESQWEDVVRPHADRIENPFLENEEESCTAST
jgi:hypothetical protein